MSNFPGDRDPHSTSTYRPTYPIVALVFVAALALAFGAGVGAAAPGADASAQQAAASGTLQEDQLEEGERGHVQDSTAPPYSATVSVYSSPLRKPTKSSEPALSGGMASGVLVSDRHVVTAAHVVTDKQSEEIYDADELQVAPGANANTDHIQFPYGTADVESVYVEANPYTTGWEGRIGDWFVSGLNAEVDFAILTLDRPVGQHAGTMQPVEPPADPTASALTAGYPSDQDSSEQWLSKGGQEALDTFDWDNLVEMEMEVSRGNSGGPYWVAGQSGTVAGVLSYARPDAKYAGAAGFTEARIDRVEEQIQTDGAVPARPDLAIIDDEQKGLYGRYTPVLSPDDPTVVGDDGFVEPSIAVFNNGPGVAGGADEDVEVGFYLADQGALVRGVDDLGTEICRDTIDAVDPYDQQVASCVATDFSDVEAYVGDDGRDLDVYAVVDPDDEIEEYTDAERLPVKVGQGVTFEQRTGWHVTEVDVPETVDAGDAFSVDVTVQNFGSGADSVDVTLDGSSADCSGESATLYAQPGATNDQTFECTAADVGIGTASVTVSAGDANATADVGIVRPVTDSGTFAVRDVSVSHPVTDRTAIPPGATIDVSVTVENVGSASGVRTVALIHSVYNDTGAFVTGISCDPDWYRQVSLDPGERTTVSGECRLPFDGDPTEFDDVLDERRVGLVADIDSKNHDRDSASVNYWFDRRNVENAFVGSVGVPSTLSAGQSATVDGLVRNEGTPDVDQLTVTAGDEVLFDEEVYLAYGDTVDVTELWEVDPGTRGEQDVTIQLDDERSTTTVTVNPQPFDVAADVPTVVGTDGTAAFDVTVANRGGDTDTHDLELRAAGTVVAEQSVTLSGGEQQSVTVTASLPDDLAGQTGDLVIASDTDEVNETVEFVPDCVRFEGNVACDVNGDGEYRDVTGDGAVTNSDVTQFFQTQHTSAWNDRPEYFDFDDNGDVGQSDVTALYEYVTS